MPDEKTENHVWVYQDTDNNVVEVFDSFEKAEQFLRDQWGHDPEWEKCRASFHDIISDYVSVYKRKIK